MTVAYLLLAAGTIAFAVVLAARRLMAVKWRQSLLALELKLPLDLVADQVLAWLNSVAAALHGTRLDLLPPPPLALEVISDASGVRHVLLLPRAERATVLAGLRAALPGVRVQGLTDYLARRPTARFGIESTLSNPRRQLSVERKVDTATALLSALQPTEDDETIVVQWIFTGAGTPSPVTASTRFAGRLDTVSGGELQDGEAVHEARAKQVDALLRASLRIGVAHRSRAGALRSLARVFGQGRGLNAPGVRLDRAWWITRHRASRRLDALTLPITAWPLLLSTRELTGLLPLPTSDVALPGVTLGLARQLPPPSDLPVAGALFGISNYPDMERQLYLAASDRLQHLHVMGPTGTGKSTLLANLVLQDIGAGHGVVVIDPKADLVSDVLARLPESRHGDVIVADATSTDRPIGFNILRSAHDEQSRELVVDHVIHIWHELYKDFWGPRSEDVLRGALLTLINTKASNGEPFTLIETPEILTNNALRKFVTEQDTVPAALGSFWAWYRGIQPMDRFKIIGPILNKLRAATLRTPIRLMLGQAEGIELDEVLAQRKILLVPLSSGTLGAETAGLLGTVLLAALWQAILGRVALPISERHTVFVYVDEAQAVLKLPVDLADMLAQARGLGVGFTLAHQYLGQIDDPQVKAALLGTVRNQLVFQCLRDDATTLARSYAPWLTAQDLLGLAAFEFAARVTVSSQILAPLTGTTLRLNDPTSEGQAIAEASRARFGRPRNELEQSLKLRGRAPEDEDGSTKATKPKTYGRRRKPADGSEATK